MVAGNACHAQRPQRADKPYTTTGRELALLFEGSTMHFANPAIELDREAAASFAALIDYSTDYRDCADGVHRGSEARPV
jgi:hypothetical protein